MPAPPDASILRAIEVPDAGGDTCWANTAEAYRRLPETLRQTVDGLRAVHSNLHDASDMFPTREGQAAYRKVFASTVYESEHPVVRVHPESGERALLLGHFLTGFTGLSQTDSHNLHAMLQGHVTKAENVVRWRWRKGDVAIWDNRATQHRAVADCAGHVRHLRRVTVQGSVPVGPDGFKGRLLGEGTEAAA
jgi:taurine dioxygenase